MDNEQLESLFKTFYLVHKEREYILFLDTNLRLATSFLFDGHLMS